MPCSPHSLQSPGYLKKLLDNKCSVQVSEDVDFGELSVGSDRATARICITNTSSEEQRVLESAKFLSEVTSQFSLRGDVNDCIAKDYDLRIDPGSSVAVEVYCTPT